MPMTRMPGGRRSFLRRSVNGPGKKFKTKLCSISGREWKKEPGHNFLLVLWCGCICLFQPSWLTWLRKFFGPRWTRKGDHVMKCGCPHLQRCVREFQPVQLCTLNRHVPAEFTSHCLKIKLPSRKLLSTVLKIRNSLAGGGV